MSETESPIVTPLAEVHRAAGAHLGVWFGCSLPDDWGNPAEEQRFANESVALIDKNYRAYLTFTGPDRVRYLNAILTNNIKELPDGQGIVSLLLNAQGRILAEIETFASKDELFCGSFQMIRQRLVEVIEKYIIMDDVTLVDDTEKFGTLALEGPKAEQVMREIAGTELRGLPELRWVEGYINGASQPIRCRIVKRVVGGISEVEFVVERAHLEALWKILLGAAQRAGGGPMGFKALSAQRLAQGRPWFGYDFGEKQIPHEAGLEVSHISYTKGCYTGQEIVERVRSRGQVNRRRVELLLTGNAVPQNGESLTVDDKQVGFVTRAAKSWFPTGILGMGYVNKENRALGTILKWNGGTATIVNFRNALHNLYTAASERSQPSGK